MIVLGNEHQRRHHSLSFMGGVIEEVSVEKHLGIALGVVTQKERVDSLCREMTVKTNMIASHFKILPPDILYMLFKSHAMPLYGSQILDLSAPEAERLYTTWRKCIRFLLRLPRRTHCALIPSICCDVVPQIQLCCRFAKFFRSAYTSRNPLTRMCAMLALDGSLSSVSGSLSEITRMFHCSRQDVTQLNLNNARTRIEVDDVSSIIRDLLYFRHLLKLHDNDAFILSMDEIQFAIDTLCTE